MDPQELIYHSKSPMTVYSLVMALRVHLMNAASANPDKSSADKSCTHGFETLRKLPQCQNNSSMLYDALIDLEEMFNNRQATSIDREDDNMHQRIQQQHVVTAAEVIFAPGTTENRKAGTISPKQEPETPVATPNATMAVSMPYRHYKPHQNNKKRKKGSHDDVDTSGPSQMHVFDAGPSKQKGKGKQKNKIKRISPQDTPDPITTTPMAEPQNQPIYTNNFITADPSSLQYANLGIGNFNTLPLDTSCSFIPNDPIDFSNEYIMQLMLLESANFDLPQNDMATDLLNFYDVNHSNDAVSIRLADQQPYTQPSNVKYQ
jgi:hypothetical protein